MSKQSADLILYNANVLTMNPRQPRAEVVAVRGGKIAFVGGADALKGISTPQAKLIDCQGKTVIPGFNDAHIHIFAYASSLLSVDCSPASVSSIAEIQAQIREQAERNPAG